MHHNVPSVNLQHNSLVWIDLTCAHLLVFQLQWILSFAIKIVLSVPTDQTAVLWVMNICVHVRTEVFVHLFSQLKLHR